MGLFDRWLRKDEPLSPGVGNFETLMSQMTREGVLIITRDDGGYTVYWARRQDAPLMLQTTVDALKRSVEGRGASVLEAILDCRDQAQKRDVPQGGSAACHAEDGAAAGGR
jgi:hypothetical protein